jgi:hypothetical protein
VHCKQCLFPRCASLGGITCHLSNAVAGYQLVFSKRWKINGLQIKKGSTPLAISPRPPQPPATFKRLVERAKSTSPNFTHSRKRVFYRAPTSLANNQRQAICGLFPAEIYFERKIRIARSQRAVLSSCCHYSGPLLRLTSLEQRFWERF